MKRALKFAPAGYLLRYWGITTAWTDFITRVRVGQDSIQGYPVYLKQNSSESFIRGIEAETEIEVVRNCLVYGSLTYTYGQNVTANEPFRRIPPLNGRVGISYQPVTSVWARAELLYAGAQTRLAQGDKDDNRIQKGGTPAWQIINISAGYRFQQRMMISAELHNLTNEAYRTHGSGVDGIGQSAWLAVLVEFLRDNHHANRLINRAFTTGLDVLSGFYQRS